MQCFKKLTNAVKDPDWGELALQSSEQKLSHQLCNGITRQEERNVWQELGWLLNVKRAKR